MGEPDPLEPWVARTTGPQPWRRIFHALNGVGIAAALTWWPFPYLGGVALLIAIALALLAFDAVRLNVPVVNTLFFRLFNRLVSPREARGVASSTWYMVGAALAAVLAPGPVAVSAILVLAFADPAASYFGRRWGRRPFLGGSAEGSAVFLIVALAVLLPRHTVPIALSAAVLVTWLERRSWPLDDNVAVPVGSALLLRMMESWI